MESTVIKSFSLRTPKRTCLIDITGDVADAVRDLGVADGTVTVYTPHTTAAVTINESADPDVARDIDLTLRKLIPHAGDYRHTEGNSDAHIKSSLLGCSETVLISDGKLVLGTWQGVFFCEFDGPRMRKVFVASSG
jgi:secondary thiamine-phosphate synthase enzyme